MTGPHAETPAERSSAFRWRAGCTNPAGVCATGDRAAASRPSGLPTSASRRRKTSTSLRAGVRRPIPRRDATSRRRSCPADVRSRRSRSARAATRRRPGHGVVASPARRVAGARSRARSGGPPALAGVRGAGPRIRTMASACSCSLLSGARRKLRWSELGVAGDALRTSPLGEGASHGARRCDVVRSVSAGPAVPTDAGSPARRRVAPCDACCRGPCCRPRGRVRCGSGCRRAVSLRPRRNHGAGMVVLLSTASSRTKSPGVGRVLIACASVSASRSCITSRVGRNRAECGDVQRRQVDPIDAHAALRQVAVGQLALPHDVPGLDVRRAGAPAARHGVPALVAPTVRVPVPNGPIPPTERAPAHVAAAHGPAHPRGTPGPARDPVPAALAVAPASVVRRRPAPALVRHPGPAVRRPAPAAVPVGMPVDLDPRHPDVAHGRLVAPVTVGVELARVGIELVRKVLRGAPVPAVLRILIGVPAVEIVLLVEVEPLRLLGAISPAGVRALAGREAHRRLSVVEERLAFVDAHACLAGVHVDAHERALEAADRAGGRLDLEPRVTRAHTKVEAPGPEPQDDALPALLLVAGVVELAPAVETHQRSVGELELGPTDRVRPHPISGQEGLVRVGLLGPHAARPLQAHAGLDEAQPAVAVTVLGACRCRERTGQRQHHACDDHPGPHGVISFGAGTRHPTSNTASDVPEVT